MKDVIYKVLEWLKQVIPTVTAVGSWIYHYMLSLLNKEKRAHEKTKLEKKLVENALDSALDGSSDDELIDSAIREGRSGSNLDH